MNKEDILMELEEPLRRISCGINAIELMAYGLSRVSDPYADGFHAIWNCLREAEMEIKKVMRSNGE